MNQQHNTIKIVTLNVNGLRDSNKRGRVFHYIRTLQADIICIQEPHTPETENKWWQMQWSGPSIWSHYTATLLHPRIELIATEISSDTRIMTTTINLQGQRLKVTNIYAPATKPERISFFQALSEFDQFSTQCIAGDLNSYPNPALDRCPPQNSIMPKQDWQTLENKITAYFDPIRKQHPASPQYTHKQIVRGNQTKESRIDHILLTSLWFNSATRAEVIPCPYSDHNAVVVSITKNHKTQNFRWSLNTAILSKCEFQQTTERALEQTQNSTQWDALKIWAKAIAKDHMYSERIKQQTHRYHLYQAITRAAARARKEPTSQIAKHELWKLEMHLSNTLNKAAQQAKTHNRAQWAIEGEASTKYFYKKYKQQQSSTLLNNISQPDGNKFHSTTEIHEHISNFYKQLYAKPEISKSHIKRFLKSIQLPRLNKAELQLLTSEITTKEVMQVIMNSPANKAPGPDGLPYDWYKQFRRYTVPLLVNLFNDVQKGRHRPKSWNDSHITLIPKPGRDNSQIQNWRPITLSNCDLKLYSRIMANRIQQLMDKLIHTDQTGFITGRHITNSAMNIRTVMANASQAPPGAAICFLDFEKAYDRVAHNYLEQVLLKYGMNHQTLRNLKATYIEAQATILDGKTAFGKIPLSCGVRQGDPLAPLLFNLAVEPYLHQLRIKLTGINLKFGTFKLAIYADDTTTGMIPSDIPKFLQITKNYQKASNAQINKNKSIVIPLNNTNNCATSWQQLGFQVHTDGSHIKALGYHLNTSLEGIADTWDNLIRSLHFSAKCLSQHYASVQGRTLLSMSKVLSRIWYQGQMTAPSPAQLKKIRKIIWKAIWCNKTALKPAYKTGRLPKMQGGLAILDPSTQIQALLAQWIPRMFQQPDNLWAKSLSHCIQTSIPGGFYGLATPISKRTLKHIQPQWKTIIKAWYNAQPSWSRPPHTWPVPQMLAIAIPNTTHARNRAGLTLGQLLTQTQNGQLTPRTDSQLEALFKSKMDIRRAKTAREKWNKGTLTIHPQVMEALRNFKGSQITGQNNTIHTYITLATRSLQDVTTSTVREFLDNKEVPTNENPLAKRAIGQYSKPPPDLWQRLYHLSRLPQQRELWYKLLYNALPLGRRIMHFQPAKQQCLHCMGHTQTIQHFTYKCKLAQMAWKTLSSLLSTPPVTQHTALYGWPLKTKQYSEHEGARRQVGHAMVLRTLWLANTKACYKGQQTSVKAIPVQLKFHLEDYISLQFAIAKQQHRTIHFWNIWKNFGYIYNGTFSFSVY